MSRLKIIILACESILFRLKNRNEKLLFSLKINSDQEPISLILMWKKVWHGYRPISSKCIFIFAVNFRVLHHSEIGKYISQLIDIFLVCKKNV
jgi:hypothetical protein